MKSVIIIPTYNEKDNIGQLLDQIFNLGISDLHVLIVDDNSPDGTAVIIKQLQANPCKSQLHIIERAGKLGLGSAYIAGFKWALDHDADLIFEMDADGSHDPEDLPRLITAIRDNKADMVIGSRRVKGGDIVNWGWHRHLSSWGAMALARLILNLKTKDVTAGFRCYHKRVLNNINLDSIKTNGYAFQEEMLYLVEKNNFSVLEIPVTFKDRERGKSKLSFKDILEFFITMIRLKFDKQ